MHSIFIEYVYLISSINKDKATLEALCILLDKGFYINIVNQDKTQTTLKTRKEFEVFLKNIA